MSPNLNESPEKRQLGSLAEAVAATLKILQSERTCSPMMERLIERFLIDNGETAIEQYIVGIAEATKDRSDESRGPYAMPEIAISDVAAGGVSQAENGELFPIPSTLQEYQEERLRLLAKTAVQRALGRKVVVNVGIGFIGTANIAAAANARTCNGAPAYFVIGYQRPSAHSSWKVDFMNRGLPTVTTEDSSLAEMINASVVQGNLTATFLQQQSLAVADVIFVETELHVRKTVARAIERAETAPETTLQLLQQIAAVMPAHALLVIESTVYPGFTCNDALPLINRVLRARGLLDEGENANVAYGFHRVKPGSEFMHSFFVLPRDAGGITHAAGAMLREYYETSGIGYRMHEDITTSELIKDVENAAKYGVLDLMSAFLKAAEATGVNGFRVIESIATARPEEHGRYVNEIAGLQVGGYCVPKELGLLINGLRRHYAVSELGIREMFHSRIASSAISDYRAEDAVYLLIRKLGAVGVSINRAQIVWAGVSYKEGVGDTRMAGTERGVRYAAHLGVKNRVTDPLVVNWPELQQQRLGDPECWGHGLKNQDGLRDISVHTAIALAEMLSPADDAIVLAVRHPMYLGTGKPEAERRDANGEINDGLSAVELSASVLGQHGKVIIDSHDFLSDADIKALLALGWQVAAFGKGHIDRLAEQISDQERIDLNEQLLAQMLRMLEAGGSEQHSQEAISEGISTVKAELSFLRIRQAGGDASRLRDAERVWQSLRSLQRHRYRKGPSIDATGAFLGDVLEQQRNDLFNRFRQTGEMLIALSEQAAMLRRPDSLNAATDLLKSLRYLRHAGLDGLNQDVDRLAHELMGPEASTRIASRLRALRGRPELAISNLTIEHPLFDPASAPQARLLPATVFATDDNGRLQRIEDPGAIPYRLSTKWVPDLAALLESKSAFPQHWSKFTMEVPIYLRRVSDAPIEFELYEDFLFLPLEFREWLVNCVWQRGYILSTLDGEEQDKIAYLMDVNLDPLTVARGRGGIVFWLDTRQPVLLTTPQGREIPLELKAIGDYRGGNADGLKVNYDRTIISGRVEGGGTARTNLGQVPGHMFSADDINWQERMKTMGPYLEGRTPRSVFRARWSYPEQPNETYQMVGRGSPSSQRLGHVFFSTDDHDVTPDKAAYVLGWNNAEVLGYDIVAVHIAMNLDNVMSNGYYTDAGSNIDLYCERDPKACFRDYGGYGLLMVLYTYDQMKAFQQGSSHMPVANISWLQAWFNGFLDRFLELQHGRLVPNKDRFESFYRVQDRLQGDPAAAESIVDEWLHTLWRHYLPFHLLRNRIGRGYSADSETAFSAGSDQRMFDVADESKAIAFLANQRDLIETARLIAEETNQQLNFDYDAALSELTDKQNDIGQLLQTEDADYSEIYQLSFYRPLKEEVYTVLDSKHPDRLVIAKARPTIFVDKMEANISQRMRLSGLRITRMLDKAADTSGEAGVVALIRAYTATWRAPDSGDPAEQDIRAQDAAASVLKLVRKDLQMASMMKRDDLANLSDLQWVSIEEEEDGARSEVVVAGRSIHMRLTDEGILHVDDDS